MTSRDASAISSPAEVRLRDVFTPGGIAWLTYVERQKVLPAVTAALSTTGYQLLLTGPTGSGKTTHILNKLHQFFPDQIVLNCESHSTVQDLVEQAIATIGAEITTETVRSEEKSRKLEAAALLGPFRFLWGGSSKEVSTRKQVPVAVQKPTAQLLGKVLGLLDTPWVLDNFHVVSPDERAHLADTLRVVQEQAAQWNFNGAKVIVLGTGLSSLEFISFRPDLSGRLLSVEMPLMDVAELQVLIARGCEQLNVRIPEDIVAEIVRLSDGLPGVCHGLCAEVCRAAGIEHRSDRLRELAPRYFDQAIVAYADIQAAKFEHRLRLGLGSRLMDIDVDGHHVLHALTERGKDEVALSVLHQDLRAAFPGISRDQVLQTLELLALPTGGELVQLDPQKEFCRLTEPLIALAFTAMNEDISAQTRAKRLAEDFRELMQG